MLRGPSEGLSLSAFPHPHSLLEGAGLGHPGPARRTGLAVSTVQLSGTPHRDPSLLTPKALSDPASSWVQR